MFERFDLMQYLGAVEHLDVLRLRRREAADGPREVNEVRFHRLVQQVHAAFVGKMVRLFRVARTARGDDVRPRVEAAARKRDDVIAGEGLSRTKLDRRASAILAGVPVAREEESVRD